MALNGSIGFGNFFIEFIGFEQDCLVECSSVGNDESKNFRRDRGMGRNVCMFHAALLRQGLV